MPPLRPLHWFVFALVGVLFFAWGVWLMQVRQVQPLPWLLDWRGQVLEPLAEDRLDLAALARAAEGELWLQSRLDGPRLLYRAELQGDGLSWQVEAELALSREQRDSLAEAVGTKAGEAEQPLSRQLREDLGSQLIATLTLKPAEAFASERLIASFGQPRLLLELAEGQAWVYPQQGLTVHLRDDEVQLLHAVPRRALRQPSS
jgi:hypothetical protein